VNRVLAILSLAALPGLLAMPAQAQRRVSVQHAIGAGDFVRIHNIAGNVKVTGWDRDSVVATGTVHDTPNERFTVTRAEGGITLGLWDTSVQQATPSVLEVRVPAGAQVYVRTGSSTVFVGSVTGTVDINTVSGMVEVAGTPRDLTVETLSGDVMLDARARVTRARTATGAIRIRGSYADLTATSVSGSITVATPAIERGRFESISGDLRYTGDVARDAVLDFVTHAGAVEFVLPDAPSAEFIVHTYEGELESRFRAPIRYGGGKLKGREMSFTLGQGAARISVRTFKGRVIVRPL